MSVSVYKNTNSKRIVLIYRSWNWWGHLIERANDLKSLWKSYSSCVWSKFQATQLHQIGGRVRWVTPRQIIKLKREKWRVPISVLLCGRPDTILITSVPVCARQPARFWLTLARPVLFFSPSFVSSPAHTNTCTLLLSRIAKKAICQVFVHKNFSELNQSAYRLIANYSYNRNTIYIVLKHVHISVHENNTNFEDVSKSA